MVDSSFFWGYIVTQIPGGFLAARYPANRVFGSAIATSALLNMLLPIAAKAGFQYVMLLRIVQGLVEVNFRQQSSHSGSPNRATPTIGVAALAQIRWAASISDGKLPPKAGPLFT